MSDKLQALFDEFVSRARALLIAEVQEQLASMASSPTAAPAKPGRKPKSAPGKSATKAKWQKRTPEELEALTRSIIAHLKKHPGQRSEQIAAGLGTTTKDLALPLGALVQAKQLKTAGVRRGMTYTVKG